MGNGADTPRMAAIFRVLWDTPSRPLLGLRSEIRGSHHFFATEIATMPATLAHFTP